ncbi:U1 small nuclear ribonucleoprotein 70 kDa-like [Saccostrea echinata]|uniref:U1 small nuclear ribonucleoprotein 70 kDa-like n=1 Tax=Saccostrea echinata TaxID=191078 RepID=UPI002A7F944E|nr:U1 small nuclear ribonucleoprotein 70 kDa-like [Saccostrea echinata]
MVPSKFAVLCLVALVGVLMQDASSKSFDERYNNAESPSDLEQMEDTEEHQLTGSKRDDKLKANLALIERAAKNTGLSKDEIEEIEKRGWRRRSRRGRRNRRRRARRSRSRRRSRRRRSRGRSSRGRRRSGRQGSRRRGSGRNGGGGGGFGSHIQAISGGLDAINSGLDLAHKLTPDNNPDNADQGMNGEEMNGEEDTF